MIYPTYFKYEDVLSEYSYLIPQRRYPIVKDKNVPERNSPCNCGSGKKYKKCCIIKNL